MGLDARPASIHSSTWDWDHASPPEQWQRAHNDRHHVNTNVLGKDNDLGYGIMRVDEAQEWEPRHLVQPLVNLVNACIFEWGVAMYDLDLGAALREGKGLPPRVRSELRTTACEPPGWRARTTSLHPVASLPTGSFRSTLTANIAANVLRNVWSHSVIMCGHFPEGVATFEVSELDESESRGEWYLRQMLGLGGHLRPPLAARPLRQPVAPDRAPPVPRPAQQPLPRAGRAVRALFAAHGLRYHSASLPKQVASAWHKVVRLSLPDDRRPRPEAGWRG